MCGPRRVRCRNLPETQVPTFGDTCPYPYCALAESKMSPSLPPEIHNLIIDHLYDEPNTLNACCLVSKSWIQRTRKHLFAVVKFGLLRRSVASWRKTLSGPYELSCSPYTDSIRPISQPYRSRACRHNFHLLSRRVFGRDRWCVW